MLTDYDIFYAASDRDRVYTSGGVATTTTSAKTLDGVGTTFDINTPSVEWIIGQIVKISNTAATPLFAHCRVAQRLGTTVTLLPINATGDTALLNSTQFAIGSTITGQSIFTDALTLVIDLTEATGSTSIYNYVFAASVAATAFTGGTSVRIITRGLCDDPYNGTAIGDAQHTGTGLYLGTNLANFTWVELSLEPGNRYEFRVLVASTSQNGIARAENPRIAAFRCESLFAAYQSPDIAETTSTAYVELCATETIPTGFGGTYLALASWLQGTSVTGAANASTVRVRKTGTTSTNLNQAIWTPATSGNYRAGGYVSILTLVDGDAFQLAHAVESGGAAGLTSQVRKSRVILAALPEGVADAFSRKITDGTSASLAAGVWQDLVSSDTGYSPPTMASGTWVDFIHVGNTAAQVLRPKFDSTISTDWEMRGGGNPESNGAREYANFWINQVRRDSTPARNTVQIRPSSSGTAGFSNCVFTYLRRADEQRIESSVPILIAADVESGMVLKRSWSDGGTGLYTRPCPEFELITRLLVNGVEYTRMGSAAAVTSVKQFHWNPTLKILTVKIDAITVNGVSITSPTSNFLHVFVVSPYLVTRDGDVVLTDNQGIVRQYEARLSAVPGITQELSVQSEGCEVGTSYGQIELASTDGAFTDAFSQRIFDGMGIRVYRGRTGIDTKLRRMAPIISANLGLPSLTTETVSFDVYDGSLVLKRPVSNTLVAAYKGETRTTDLSGTAVPDTRLPLIYGFMRRLPAYRVDQASNYSIFKVASPVAGAPLQKIGIFDTSLTSPAWVNKAYFDQEKYTSTCTISNVELALGTFRVAIGVTNWKDDVLWVDVLGPALSSTTIESPGAIMLSLLLRAGISADAIDQPSFRLLDRKWRTRYVAGKTDVRALQMGFAFYEETFAEALTLVAKHSFTYWSQSRSGRFRVGVPEIETQNMLTNPGFESSASSIYPWRLSGDASVSISQANVYYGNNAAQISNGNSRLNGALSQTVLFHRAGKYAITALISQQTGNNTSVRIAFIPPGDGFTRTVSEPVEISSTKWGRVSLLVDIDEGMTGTGVVEIVPHLTSEKFAAYPPIYNSLNIWLRPEELAGSTGDLISKWPNVARDGLDADFAVTSPDSRPTLINDAIAGHKGLYFKDGVNSLRIYPDFTADRGCIFAVVMLRNRDDTTANRSIVTATANNFHLGTHPGFFTQYWSAQITASTYLDATTVTVEEYTPTVVMFRRIAANSSAIYVNGTVSTTSTASSQLSIYTPEWYLGADPTGGGQNNSGSFYMSELMVYDSNLSDARIATVFDYLLSKYGLQSAAINIDSVEVVPVAVSVESSDGDATHARNARLDGYEIRGEHFYEAAVPFNINSAKPDSQLQKAVIGDNEARGIQQSYDVTLSEAAATLMTSGRLELPAESSGGISAVPLGDPALGAGLSALSVANSLALRFSRQGAQTSFSIMDFERIPEVGETVFHQDVKGMSKTSTDYPLWQIITVDDTSAPATELSIVAERQIDPVFDRPTIVPSELPVGAIVVVTAGSACPTDYVEVSEMRGFYAAAGTSASLEDTYGSPTHAHGLTHTHLIAQHAHAATVTSPTAGGTGTETTSTGGDDNNFVWGARGPSSGNHTHNITSNTSFTVNESASSASSKTPVTAIATLNGSNHVSHRRVLFCRRIGKTQSNIDTSIVLGYTGAASPSGWKNCDGSASAPNLVGYALRGANPGVGAKNLAATASFYQSATGAWIGVAQVDEVLAYERVTVTNGASSFHGVVTAISPQNKALFVVSTHDTGDTPDGTLYPSGCTVGTGSQDVAQTFTPATHGHHSSGSGTSSDVPSHAHLPEHLHAGIKSPRPTIGIASDQVVDHYYNSPYPSYHTVLPRDHNHGGELTDANIPKDPASSASAGGAITQDVYNSPKRVECMFITPTNGTQTLVPSGATVFYSGAACPSGWVVIDMAGLVIGKSSGAIAIVEGGHSHAMEAQAHTYPHDHTGTTKANVPVMRATKTQGSGYYNYGGGVTGAYITSAPEYEPHGHTVDVTIAAATASLTATTTSTESATGTSSVPPSRRLLLCQKT